jgi:hypothetical protein
MTKQQAKTIACGLLHDGIDADKMTAKGRAEVRVALETLLALSTQTLSPQKRPTEGTGR